MTRVALVTGAARGIGAATVRALAADGWAVLAVDRCADDPALPYRLGSREELDRIVADACAKAPAPASAPPAPAPVSAAPASAPPAPAPVSAAPASAPPAPAPVSAAPASAPPAPAPVRAVVADTRDLAGLAGAVAEAERHWGGLDAAVAAAGVIGGGVPLWEMPAAQLDAVLDIDLRGVVNLARAAVPALLRRPEPRQGRFLAVASAAATRGLPMLAAYCAAKAGVTGLIRALAVELGGTGITANAVSPGSTDTSMLVESARLYGLTGPESFAAQQPVQRLLQPDEVAAALVWLAGEGSSAMTGAVVPVDGGLAL